jgi:hypothetical protein
MPVIDEVRAIDQWMGFDDNARVTACEESNLNRRERIPQDWNEPRRQDGIPKVPSVHQQDSARAQVREISAWSRAHNRSQHLIPKSKDAVLPAVALPVTRGGVNVPGVHVGPERKLFWGVHSAAPGQAVG